MCIQPTVRPTDLQLVQRLQKILHVSHFSRKVNLVPVIQETSLTDVLRDFFLTLPPSLASIPVPPLSPGSCLSTLYGFFHLHICWFSQNVFWEVQTQSHTLDATLTGFVLWSQDVKEILAQQ